MMPPTNGFPKPNTSTSTFLDTIQNRIETLNYDTLTSRWTKYTKDSLAYNQLVQLDSEEHYVGENNAWVKYSRTENIYDHKNLTLATYYVNSDSNWSPSSRTA